MWNLFETSGSADAASDDRTSGNIEVDGADVPVRPDDDGVGVRDAHVLEALQGVIDPEVGVNIVDLGLVYGVEVDDETVDISVTATTPACPMADAIRQDVERAAREAVSDRDVRVHQVWEPEWSPAHMSDAARESLGGAPRAGSGLW